MRKKFVYDELKNKFGFKNAASLQKFYTSATNNFSKFAQVEDKILSKQYSSANSINNSIVTSNIIEYNQKIINGFILQTFLKPAYVYTLSDKNTINNIALQCPMAGGYAVYQARNLMMGITNSVIEFTDNCDQKTDRSFQHTETSLNTPIITDSKSFNLYPNPNDGNMIFEYSLQEKSVGFFVLYDITGRVINKYKLTEGENNSLKIFEDQLIGGVYFYSVVIDNAIKSYNKIVIVK